MSDFFETANVDKLSPLDVRMMNPLKLAYLGDAIYEAYVRIYLISKYVSTPHEMSRMAVSYVKAKAQATIVNALKEELTEEEWTMVKRGRNQKTASVPKHAKVSDYRYATGFEALIGYLYLTEQKSRIYEIVSKGIEIMDRVKEESMKAEAAEKNTTMIDEE